jgi:hypothetical protein
LGDKYFNILWTSGREPNQLWMSCSPRLGPLARAPNGWHAFSTSYWYGQGGGGYAPSVHCCTAYLTRESALEAGINELIERFEGVRDMKGSVPEGQSALAIRMIEKLKDGLSARRQLALF